MHMHFDLISDLHLDTWDSTMDWSGQATSPICVVAGDIARDRKKVIETLQHLGQCYQLVMYIDGNDEHKMMMHDLDHSYQDLAQHIHHIPNVVFMQDNIVVLNGVAFVSSNGWYTFDFDPSINFDDTIEQWRTDIDADTLDAAMLGNWARADAAYLYRSIEKLQRHKDVRRIVIVTHTVPKPEIVCHDLHLRGSYKHNLMGNTLLDKCLSLDTEKKVHTWCFGHYHGSVDRDIDGVRYVNNCRGRGNTRFCQQVYYPKRISIEY
jgi:hypothetical protein